MLNRLQKKFQLQSDGEQRVVHIRGMYAYIFNQRGSVDICNESMKERKRFMDSAVCNSGIK